jgi:hypothetical protein
MTPQLVTVKLSLYMPKRQQMEASGQLHAPVDLLMVYTEEMCPMNPVRN